MALFCGRPRRVATWSMFSSFKKKVIIILADLDWRDSCRSAFKEMGILTVTNIYLLEVIYLATSRQLQRHMDTRTYQTRNATVVAFNQSLHMLEPSFSSPFLTQSRELTQLS
ncbi:hypothetical protein J6590_072860 [Homalodisca vitripennis]|nr:hypothetical protein J6590_072860 [Homalodisca vitripennis]